VKIFVISLNSSANERRAFQKKQFKKLNLKFTFVDVVCIDDICEKEKYNMAKKWTRSVRDIDLAIFMSHKKVWRLASLLEEPCLIIEDDAVLSKDINLFLDFLKNYSYDDNVVFDLEYVPRKHVLARKNIKIKKWSLSYIYQNKNGLACYIVTPKVAKKMLEKADVFQLVDAFFWSRRFIKPFQVEPALAIQDVFLNHSLKQHEFSFVKNGFFIFSKFIRLKLEICSLSSFILGFIFGNKRYIEIDKKHFN
jgi:glycosyl transferase family 25